MQIFCLLHNIQLTLPSLNSKKFATSWEYVAYLCAFSYHLIASYSQFKFEKHCCALSAPCYIPSTLTTYFTHDFIRLCGWYQKWIWHYDDILSSVNILWRRHHVMKKLQIHCLSHERIELIFNCRWLSLLVLWWNTKYSSYVFMSNKITYLCQLN